MSEPTPARRWAPRPEMKPYEPYRRPRTLLVVDIILAAYLLVLARFLAGVLLVPGFLSDPSSVPPAVIDANLGVPAAVLAFGLPMILAALALFRARRPARSPWTWSQLAAAWIILAFAETPLASADLTAVVLVAGFVPAALIGNQQVYLRRLAGEPLEDARWSRRRRLLILATSATVVAWLFVYLTVGAAAIRDLLPPLPFEAFPH
jgi:hypothetical protein